MTISWSGMKSGKLLSLEVFVCWPYEGLKTLPQHHTVPENCSTCGAARSADCQLTSAKRQAEKISH